MDRTLIVNASPIICLAKANLADLLLAVSNEVIVPRAVMAEIMAGPPADAGRRWLESAHRIISVSIDSIHPEVSVLQLGSGETSVIQAGLIRRAGHPILLLDDYRARKAAASFGLQCCGTVGLLIKAKRQGNIATVHEPLQRLKDAGLYIHPGLIEEALKLSGES
ncbi:MAG: DUF3368 domain-containing protein [Leptonema illini]|uniref:DUF3368 domain-containing protein n=1 Tax=Leptonema illini TaxID=183 RepID=A0A833H1T6_9LEPT|nr:MAG: DUF3368 domain-containing protein [Leptonema illini]